MRHIEYRNMTQNNSNDVITRFEDITNKKDKVLVREGELVYAAMSAVLGGTKFTELRWFAAFHDLFNSQACSSLWLYYFCSIDKIDYEYRRKSGLPVSHDEPIFWFKDVPIIPKKSELFNPIDSKKIDAECESLYTYICDHFFNKDAHVIPFYPSMIEQSYYDERHLVKDDIIELLSLLEVRGYFYVNHQRNAKGGGLFEYEDGYTFLTDTSEDGVKCFRKYIHSRIKWTDIEFKNISLGYYPEYYNDSEKMCEKMKERFHGDEFTELLWWAIINEEFPEIKTPSYLILDYLRFRGEIEYLDKCRVGSGMELYRFVNEEPSPKVIPEMILHMSEEDINSELDMLLAYIIDNFGTGILPRASQYTNPERFTVDDFGESYHIPKDALHYLLELLVQKNSLQVVAIQSGNGQYLDIYQQV